MPMELQGEPSLVTVGRRAFHGGPSRLPSPFPHLSTLTERGIQ